MRLSEDRIYAIAEKVAIQLRKKGMAITRAPIRQLAAWVEKPIMENLTLEDTIDAEVTRYIQGLSNPPPEGSYDYQALFRKKKDELARRRGFDK